MYENNSSYLIHSAKGTNWAKKAHKYISRVWKKGKWVYEYPITGKGYEKEFNRYAGQANYYVNKINDENASRKDFGYHSRGEEAFDKSFYQAFKAYENYRDKSLVGLGKSIVWMLFDKEYDKDHARRKEKLGGVGLIGTSEEYKPRRP